MERVVSGEKFWIMIDWQARKRMENLGSKAIGWLSSLTHRKPRSNSQKNDGVVTSREWANERPQARSQDQPLELEVTELRGQDK